MQQALQAKQAAMQKWISSMQAVLVATAPLRRAAAALIGQDDLLCQDELLASYGHQLKAFSLSIGSLAGGPAGRSMAGSATAGTSDA